MKTTVTVIPVNDSENPHWKVWTHSEDPAQPHADIHGVYDSEDNPAIDAALKSDAQHLDMRTYPATDSYRNVDLAERGVAFPGAAMVIGLRGLGRASITLPALDGTGAMRQHLWSPSNDNS